MKTKKPGKVIVLLKHNNGFTTLEVVTALLIASVFNAALWQGLGVSSRSLAQFWQKSTQQELALTLYNATKSELNNLSVPFYLAEAPVYASDSSIALPYYGGSPADSLLIVLHNEQLTLGSNSSQQIFNGVKGVSAKKIRSAGGKVTGVVIYYQLNTLRVAVYAHLLGVS